SVASLSSDRVLQRFVADTVERAQTAVVVRLLGGRRTLEAGFDLIRDCCVRRNVPFIACAGDSVPDPELTALSTAPPELVHEVFAYVSHGGAANVRNLLLRLSGEAAEPPAELPWFGLYQRAGAVAGEPDQATNADWEGEDASLDAQPDSGEEGSAPGTPHAARGTRRSRRHAALGTLAGDCPPVLSGPLDEWQHGLRGCAGGAAAGAGMPAAADLRLFTQAGARSPDRAAAARGQGRRHHQHTQLLHGRRLRGVAAAAGRAGASSHREHQLA